MLMLSNPLEYHCKKMGVGQYVPLPNCTLVTNSVVVILYQLGTNWTYHCCQAVLQFMVTKYQLLYTVINQTRF